MNLFSNNEPFQNALFAERVRILPIDELPAVTSERNTQMDDALRTSLKALGRECSDNDCPRTVATDVINSISAKGRRSMQRLTAKLWRPDTSFSEVPIAVLKERARELLETQAPILTPEQVEREVTLLIAELLERKEYDFTDALISKFPSSGPVGYGSHIEMSGHDTGNGQVFQSLLTANRVTPKGPFLEVGARGGNTTAEMIKRGLVRADSDNVVLVDPNEDCIDYANQMLRPRLSERLDIEARGIEAVARDSEIGAAYTALTLQWIDSEGDGRKIFPSVVENLRRVLEPGGQLWFVGEEPVNATAATPMSIKDSLDIGFSNGALPYEAVQRALEVNGFEPMNSAVRVGLSIPKPSPEFLSGLDPETRRIVDLLYAYSDHDAVGTVYTNVGKSKEF